MRTILFFLSVLSAAGPVSAQHFSVGASAGMDLWLNRQSYLRDKQLIVAPGMHVLLRYHMGEKWLMEANAGISGRRDFYSYYTTVYDGIGDIFVEDEFHPYLYTASLQVQRLVASGMQHRLRHFIGLSAGVQYFTPRLTERVYDSHTKKPLPTAMKFAYDYASLHSWNGLHYRLNYQFQSRWSAELGVAFEADLPRLFGEFFSFGYSAPYSRFSLQLGTAYRLN
jgi:hypothetical protein